MTADLRRITGGAVNARSQSSALLTFGNGQRWMLDGLCNEFDGDLFFPTPGHGTGAAAKAICAKCPVLSKCRDYGLDNTEIEGVWGGLSHDERKELRARRRGLRTIVRTTLHVVPRD